jgi:hypothetical protein
MMPQMQDVLNQWQEKITLIKITQVVNSSGLLDEAETPLTFLGTIQPLVTTSLQVNSDGQRKFPQWQIHTKFKLHLAIGAGDRVAFKGINYKVMADKDYSRNGYLEYHLIEYING